METGDVCVDSLHPRAFSACEKLIPQAGHEARHIMALIRFSTSLITKQVYDAYHSALSGQAEFENVVDSRRDERDIASLPDATTPGPSKNCEPWP